MHISTNVVIRNNQLFSVHGRLFVSNSKNVLIRGNYHERVPDAAGQWQAGISLLYIGPEGFGSNNYPAPQNHEIVNNTLYYPSGSVDAAGGMIYLYGVRDANCHDNDIVCDAMAFGGQGIYVLPALLSSWVDPDGLDPGSTMRVHRFMLFRNRSLGANPRRIIQSGNNSDFPGPGLVDGNLASGYQFYSPTITFGPNNKTLPPGLGLVLAPRQ